MVKRKYKDVLACVVTLLLLLQTAGGAMGQNKSQNRPQNKSQNGSQTNPQTNPQTDASLSGKWTGSLELISGFGRSHIPNGTEDSDPMTHLLEQVKFKIGRYTPTFSFSTQAQGLYEKNETYTNRITMRGKDRTEILGRISQFIKPGSSLRSDFGWHPTPGQQISAYLSYEYGFDDTDNNSASIITDLKESFLFKTALEDSRTHQHVAAAGWQTSHHLGSSRRQLLTAGDWRGKFNNHESQWARLMMPVVEEMPTEESKSTKYRLTSYTSEQEGKLSVSYRDSLIKGVHHLTVEPGVKTRLSRTWNDNNGAVNVDNYTWRDSTGLHEDFDFFIVQLEPQLRMEYQYSSLRFSADYSLQFYGRDLSSQLRDQQMKWRSPALIGRSFIEWTPGIGHQLILGSSLSVTHPGYEQQSWYARQGTDPNQLVQGNPDLSPTRLVSTDLTWRFNKGRFGLTASTIYDYTTGEIE